MKKSDCYKFIMGMDPETRRALRRVAQATERSRAAVVRWLIKREAERLSTAKVPANTEEACHATSRS
jgi:predicted transcriptional regulator